MKVFIMIGLLFTSTFAFADAAVGDYAKFEVLFQQGLSDPGTAGTIELRILSKDANGNFLVQGTRNFQGTVSEEKFQLEGAQVPTDQQIDELLANCAAYGGTLGSVTIETSVIPTCKLVNTSEYSLSSEIAKVPFGFVSDVSRDQNNNYTTARMVAFAKGQ